MVSAVTVTIALLVVILQVSLTGYVYLDAPEWGLDARKWALVTLLVPFFGIFAYLFERDERRPDPDQERRDEMFVDGAFQVHKSRADDAPWVSDARADGASSTTPPEEDGENAVTDAEQRAGTPPHDGSVDDAKSSE